MVRRLHAYYDGSVQGVGFRYTVQRSAEALGLAGWARNLPDGRVEVILEGTKADIKKFLQKIESVFSQYIRDADVEWGEATGEFNGFDIRFH
ncbi:MAG: acylphosphatase [Candidatus Omnitrophica bacterium]|nr:acylphosphatase [Candidatus Omnitrophota bacterium]